MSVPPVESVLMGGTPRGADREAIDALDEIPGPDPTGALLGAIARGRVVRRLRENCPGSEPTWITVVEADGGATLIVHDRLRYRWTGYRAASVESGIRAARAILSTGSAFNW